MSFIEITSLNQLVTGKDNRSVNPFYDGETFYLYAYSFGELLELIRKFVEPSDEIGDVLDSSTEMKTYRNTITEIFKN